MQLLIIDACQVSHCLTVSDLHHQAMRGRTPAIAQRKPFTWPSLTGCRSLWAQINLEVDSRYSVYTFNIFLAEYNHTVEVHSVSVPPSSFQAVVVLQLAPRRSRQMRAPTFLDLEITHCTQPSLWAWTTWSYCQTSSTCRTNTGAQQGSCCRSWTGL